MDFRMDLVGLSVAKGYREPRLILHRIYGIVVSY